MEPWWQKFIWMLVDKVLFGSVAVLLAYVIAKRVEVFRRKQATTLELGKHHVQAFVDVFTALGRVEAIVLGYIEHVSDSERRQFESPWKIEDVRPRVDAAIAEIGKHYFLLSNQELGLAHGYLNFIATQMVPHMETRTPLTPEIEEKRAALKDEFAMMFPVLDYADL